MSEASVARWAELESRAGASDTDREAWLAERRSGVTATEISRLAKSGDLDADIDALVREKVTAEDGFTGNAYTAWGKEREPVIAGEAEVLYGFRHESRVFQHPVHSRWLASPDGILVSVDGAVSLLEIKTAGWPLNGDSIRHKGYYDQMQWQMLVLGADRCLLMWEERIEGLWGFEPGRSGEVPVWADTDRQKTLMQIAEQFLAALDHALEYGLPVQAGEDPLLTALVTDLLILRKRVDDAEEYLREYLDAKATKSAKTDQWTLSYTFAKPRRTFDKAAFEEAHPGEYESYLKPGNPPERATLRITSPKVGGENGSEADN